MPTELELHYFNDLGFSIKTLRIYLYTELLFMHGINYSNRESFIHQRIVYERQ